MHNALKWLTKKRMDGNNRAPSHELFDARTLLMPNEKKFKATPAQAQWWKFKASNMDCILCFKVGKFYEIFHQDADAAINALPNDLVYMKGQTAHCGFPEIAFHKVIFVFKLFLFCFFKYIHVVRISFSL